MRRRTLVRLLAFLDASPLPASDPVRLELEAELLELLEEHSPLRFRPPPRRCLPS